VEWDTKLNSLLDNFSDTAALDSRCGYTLVIGEFEVWIKNRWYSYGTAYWVKDQPIKRDQQFRPKFKTMLRLHKLVTEIQDKKVQEAIKEIYG
jgi:hypothetical protein